MPRLVDWSSEGRRLLYSSGLHKLPYEALIGRHNRALWSVSADKKQLFRSTNEAQFQ
jgi:hypothetical protein